MTALKIEDLLNDLTDDGVLESTGSFTLDPKKAEEKLRNFAFASPNHYLLKLVQCAVAGGASAVEVEVGPWEISIKFDGEPFVGEQVSGLASYLLNNDIPVEQRRYRHLAAGLRGAAASSPEAVILDFDSVSSRLRRTWDAQGWRQSPASGKPGHHIFTLDRTLRQSVKAAGEEISSSLGSGNTTEETLLRERCRYAPCPILLDGETLPAGRFGLARYPGYDIYSDPNPGESRPPRYLEPQTLLDEHMVAEHHLAERIVPGTLEDPGCLPLPQSQATLKVEPPASGPCRSWLAITAALETPKLIYVEDGVVIQEEEAPEIPVCGFFAVVSALGLRKDLTGFQLVRDQFFQEQRAWLREEALLLKSLIAKNLALFPNRERIGKELL